MKNEHEIQNAIRLAISDNKLGTCFRCNVGQAYTGDSMRRQPDGSMKIINPRPLNTGLPKGFSDLLVIRPVVITPDMVGQTIATAAFLEIKAAAGRISQDQVNFMEQMKKLGAKAGVVRSVEDVMKLLC